MPSGIWALGIPLDYVTIVGRGTQPQPHTQPQDPSQGTEGQKELIYASGVITGLMAAWQQVTSQGIVELLVTRGNDTFEIRGMLSGAVGHLPKAGLVAPGEDLHRINVEGAPMPFRPYEAVAFWRDCERFIETAAPAVSGVAVDLAGRGRLEGDDVSRLATAAMAGRPHMWIPPWAN